MRVSVSFPFKGYSEIWTVPKGVVEASFEVWGAAGGMASGVVDEVQTGKVHASNAPSTNIGFNNHPSNMTAVGKTYSNNAGYALGIKPVKEGEAYRITVGGNGGGGYSSIRKNANGTYTVTSRGGVGGYNGGGTGGLGKHVKKNLYNSPSTTVAFSQAATPGAANAGQLWLRTDTMIVYRCKKKYTSGGSIATNWVQVTDLHQHFAGRSGGGGGGATDIRQGGPNLTDRILVAGGAGGAGGAWSNSGADKWILQRCPGTPSPPFGDDTSVTGPTGPNKTWVTRVNYISSGWGAGGVGGGSGPEPGVAPTTDAGTATIGGHGGLATGRHKIGSIPPGVPGSGGAGGSNLTGGAGGRSGGTAGSLGNGGTGATAAGADDDFCSGGGGGGGGYFGGGGGGMGFLVLGASYKRTQISTQGGGGGGGSSYAAPVFKAVFFAGATRPPAAATNSGNGANGRGGFARITYRLPPRALWNDRPATVVAGSTFPVTFDYEPAEDGGSKIDYYVVGSATDPAATFPTVQSTIQIEGDQENDTTFTYSGFVAPASAGTSYSYFVKAVDKDGDNSDWIKQVVKAVAAPAPGATITAPAADSQFIDSATVTWTLGSQSPLAAYRLALVGTPLTGPQNPTEYPTGWLFGGSRVNLVNDPGFQTPSTSWAGTGVTRTSSTSFPGVSGKSGSFVWTTATDGTCEAHTSPTWDNLLPGVTYRLSVGVASGTANDARLQMLRIEDDKGILSTRFIDTSALAAGVYTTVEMEFTPRGQGVFARLIPSDSGGDFGNSNGQTTYLTDMLLEIAYQANVQWSDDFEDATTIPVAWSATNATLSQGPEFYSGAASLRVTTTAAAAVTVYGGAGGLIPVKPGQRYTAAFKSMPSTTANATNSFIQWYTAAGVFISASTGVAQTGALDTWRDHSLTAIAPANAGLALFGMTLTAAAIGELWNMDLATFSIAPRGTYFDGTNINGNTGSVAWSGGTNTSPSVLTGTNRLSGLLTATDVVLVNASIALDTLATGDLVAGTAKSRATVSVKANPSLPATAVVSLEVNSVAGYMLLEIDSADGSLTNKTVSFDIFRNGVRIVTGLRPNGVTRTASYKDVPAHGEQAVYVVRALDASGGYTDTSDGNVTVVE